MTDKTNQTIKEFEELPARHQVVRLLCAILELTDRVRQLEESRRQGISTEGARVVFKFIEDETGKHFENVAPEPQVDFTKLYAVDHDGTPIRISDSVAWHVVAVDNESILVRFIRSNQSNDSEK